MDGYMLELVYASHAPHVFINRNGNAGELNFRRMRNKKKKRTFGDAGFLHTFIVNRFHFLD